jgi:hypothetical protein
VQTMYLEAIKWVLRLTDAPVQPHPAVRFMSGSVAARRPGACQVVRAEVQLDCNSHDVRTLGALVSRSRVVASH